MIEGGALVEAMIAASKKRLTRQDRGQFIGLRKQSSKQNKKMAQHFNMAIHMCAINMTNRTPAHRSADERYNNKRDVKRVSFNTEKSGGYRTPPKLEQIPDFTNWVKSKIDNYPPSAG